MAAKKTLLLEKLYGKGELRPFEGLTKSQNDVRNDEIRNAHTALLAAGEHESGMSQQAMLDKYYSRAPDHWSQLARDRAPTKAHVPNREYRYYTMHPANAEGLMNDLRSDPEVDFQVKSFDRMANKMGRKSGGYYGGTHAWGDDDGDTVNHPRIQFSVKASAAKHDELLNKHAQHLVFEGRTFDAFFKEALDSVTVAGVDGIPRTQPVKNEDDQLENDDAAIYNGVLPNPTDTLNKIFDAETQARLAAVYGPNWHQLVSQSLATIPSLQPDNRDAVNEHIEVIKESVANLTEELAAALNYVNSVDHGNQKPRFKSAMAWLEGVGHLYGDEVAGKANDVLYSKGHKAALDFVREAAKNAGDPKTVNMTGAAPTVGRLNDGPYSQLHSIHLAEDFRPGLLNPGGVFGRQGDEVYTKTHGSFSTDHNRIGPYGEKAKGAPESVLYTDPHTQTITKHLDGLKANGQIHDYKWEHYVDEDSRTRARLKITATHADHKAIANSLNTVLHNASQKRYAERDAWFAGQRDADSVPNSPNTKPITVSPQDRAVHRILKDNPDATDEEVGKAWDDHVRAGTVDAGTVPKLVVRYRSRVAYHQGKGNLPE